MSGLGSLEMSGFRSAKRTLSASVFKEFCHERAWFDHGDYA